jgi:hypothetical protein
LARDVQLEQYHIQSAEKTAKIAGDFAGKN